MPISLGDLNLPLRGARAGWDVPLRNAFGAMVDSVNAQEAATEAAVGVISGAVDANDATIAAAVDGGAATSAALAATYTKKADVQVIDKGTISPNIALGGFRNGAAIASDVSGGVLLNSGGTGYNNVIGGDGSATVDTTTPNTSQLGTVANQSLIGGYDNVAGALSSKIISDHSYVAVEATEGHNAIYGGSGHVVNGSGTGFASIFGGRDNTASADFAQVNGGSGGTASGVASVVLGGIGNVASGAQSIASGQTSTASGAYSEANGLSCTAAASYAEARGTWAHARFAAQSSLAAGRFAALGDAQRSSLIFHRATTDGTATPIGIAGGSSGYLLQPGQSCALRARVVARQTGSSDTAAWEITGVYSRPIAGGTPTAVAAATITSLGASAGAATWTVTVVPDSTGNVGIRGTGEVGKTIRWVISVEVSEVTVT